MNGLALCTGNGGLEAALHLVLPEYRTVCAVERQAYAAASFVAWMEATGMGARNEQLLVLGNGVVPVAAAMAFVALWRDVTDAA